MKIIIKDYEFEMNYNQLKEVIGFFNNQGFDCWLEGRGDGTTQIILERKTKHIRIN